MAKITLFLKYSIVNSFHKMVSLFRFSLKYRNSLFLEEENGSYFFFLNILFFSYLDINWEGESEKVRLLVAEFCPTLCDPHGP